MSGFWRRLFGAEEDGGDGAQSAAGATAGGDIVLVRNAGTVQVNLGKERPAPSDPEEARRRHAWRLRERYHRLDLEVLTPLSEQDEHPAVHLREVFVPQLVRADPPPVELPRELLKRLTDVGEPDPARLPPGVERETVRRVREAYRRRPAVPVLPLLAGPDGHRAVLLGDPGSGKSTLARYLCLALTEPLVDPAADVPAEVAPLAGRLPLIVELRRYADPQWRERTFEDFLAHLYRTEGLGLPEELLARQLAEHAARTLVLFDGLDELFDPQVRELASRRIAAFAARYPQLRVVVTSRVIGYRREPLDAAGFGHYMLQDLDDGQIGDFAERWYANACPNDPVEAQRLRRRVTVAVASSAPVRELAGNPLILTILAIIGRRRELPRDRRTVYEHAVAVLVEHWDPSKYLQDRRVDGGMPYLASEDRLELLRLVARRMQEGGDGIAGNHIPGRVLLASFEGYLRERYELPADRAAPVARAMLQQFRERNFILSRFGGDVYGFVHRAFLEYLAAADIAYRFNRERSLTEGQLLDGVFAARWRDPAWREVLLLLAGELDERFVGEAVSRLLAAAPVLPGVTGARDAAPEWLVLAVRCLGEVRKLGLVTAQSEAVVDALTALFEAYAAEGSTYLPREAVEALDGLRPVLTGLGPHWVGRDRFLRWYLVHGHHAQRESPTSLEVGTVTARLACALQLNDPDGPGVLRAWAEHGWSSAQRAAAFGALAEGWAGDPAVEAFVRSRVELDADALTREAAVAALADGWAGDPGTGAFLAARVAESGGEGRLDEMLALGKSWRGDGPAQSLLRSIAAAEQPELRGLAVFALTVNGRVDGPLAAFLRERVRGDRDPGVRGMALRALCLQPADDPENAPFLYRVAGSDEDPELRLSAMIGLAQGWAGDPGVAEFLRLRLAEDRDPLVRRRVLPALAGRWAGDPGVAELLRGLAADPGPWDVRAGALRLLGRCWAGDPEVAEFLLECAADGAGGPVRVLALGELATHFAGAPELDAFVRGEAERAADPLVRGAVLTALSDRQEPGAAARSLFLERAVADPDARVRDLALAAVVRCYDGEERAGALLLARAAGLRDADVRLSVLRALLAHRPADPAVRALLRERAVADSSAPIRAIALHALVRGGAGDGPAAELRERAVADVDPLPRRVALRALAGAGDRAAAVELLRRRAVADPDEEARVAALRALASGFPGGATAALLAERARAERAPAVAVEAARLLEAARAGGGAAVGGAAVGGEAAVEEAAGSGEGSGTASGSALPGG
ncbi:HEAT repeat domain-containing protein [Kitasatospora sp. NPDC088134]|uniref:NACHT domain-containing protein n=1 Tax=Kitasatospora sp. NPDC088134 TaxID=3364071 RepID=UPI003811CA0A